MTEPEQDMPQPDDIALEQASPELLADLAAKSDHRQPEPPEQRPAQ